MKQLFIYEVGIGEMLNATLIEQYVQEKKEKLLEQLSNQFENEIEAKILGVVAIPVNKIGNSLQFQEIRTY